MTDDTPLVYVDACILLEGLQQTHGRWRDSFKVLQAAERKDIRLVASRLLAAEVGRFRGDASRARVDQLVIKYLDGVNTQWVEVDLLIAQQARDLSWQFGIKSGADAVHLATAVRLKADYFMSRDGGFPYGQMVESTSVINPSIVWTPTLMDTAVDNESDPDSDENPSDSKASL